MATIRSVLPTLAMCLGFVGVLVYLDTINGWAVTTLQDQRGHRLDALYSQARSQADPATAQAVDQTMACLADVMHRQEGMHPPVDHGRTWAEQRLVVWDPCVQQGADRLHLAGRDDAVPGFLARVRPVEGVLQAYAQKAPL